MCCWLAGEAGCAACNLCCCLGKTLHANRKEQVRTSYIMLIVVIMAILFVLERYLNNILDKLDFVLTCPDSAGDSISTCLGVSSIYRASLSLAIMHFLIFFICSMRNSMARAVNEGAWVCKFVFLVGVFIALLWVDNKFFVSYANVAKVVSGFFLVFQIIMIIDLSYIWAEKWIAIYEEGNSCWAIVMIIASIILYVGTGDLLVKSFGWFGEGPECSD